MTVVLCERPHAMIRRDNCTGLVSSHSNKWDCLPSAGAEGVRSGIVYSVKLALVNAPTQLVEAVGREDKLQARGRVFRVDSV